MKNVKYTNVPEIEQFFEIRVNDVEYATPESDFDSAYKNTMYSLKRAADRIVNMWISIEIEPEDVRHTLQDIKGAYSELETMYKGIREYIKNNQPAEQPENKQ